MESGAATKRCIDVQALGSQTYVKRHHQGQEQGQIRKVINGRVRMQLSAGPCLNYLKLPITLMMRRAHVTAPYMDRRSPCFSSASRDTFPAGGGTAARGEEGRGREARFLEDGGRAIHSSFRLHRDAGNASPRAD